MERKIIITREREGILTTLFEDGKAAELRLDQSGQALSVGNIYIGKVKKVVKNIQAAFIEIATGTECYYSMTENTDPIFTCKMNSLHIVEGDELLVQISKEGVKSKQPTVTSNLNFTGKYVVLTWGKGGIGVSGKIPAEYRDGLRQILQPLLKPEFGFILRTNALEASEAAIREEALKLIDNCSALLKTAPYRTCYSLMLGSKPAYLLSLRDTYTAHLSEILTDDRELYEQMEEYLKESQPEDASRLRFYQDSLLPLRKLCNLEGILQDALNAKVWMKSGAYLIIQPTEALTVIDVNTGKFTGRKKLQETFWKINLEAAGEIARQIRLRNLSGIIVVDFINMESQEAKDELMEALGKLVRKDPVKTVVVDMTPLNLVEMTRKKVRKPFYEQLRQDRKKEEI